MYRGFNLEIPEKLNAEKYYGIGNNIFKKSSQKFFNKIKSLIELEGIINGNQVINDWFPKTDSHIFLSHSHKDQKKAITLAGILYDKFKIKTFIDSCIWGNSNELLKVIDDHFCKNEENGNYSYEKRNYSTSHVHLMLSSALNQTIDNNECLFFLNTPNSVSATDSVNSKTYSSWIFSEITTSQIIRKKTPDRLKQEKKIFSSKERLSESARSQLIIEYELELNHLQKLKLSDLDNWFDYRSSNPKTALDRLYSLYPIKRKFYI
jgi:hypothetical protein